MSVERAIFSEEFTKDRELQEGSPEQEGLAQAMLDILEKEFDERRPVGEGKAAHVWIGQAPFFEKESCVKTIHNHDASVNDLGREFRLHQAASRAGVRVPRLIGYVEGKRSNGEEAQALAMEVIPGRNFEQWLEELARAKEKLPLDTFKAILAEVQRQIVLLHEAGIYHRDLHPRNLFYSEDKQVYLLDFGDATEAFGGAEDTEIYRDEIYRNGSPVAVVFHKDEDVVKKLMRDARSQDILAEAAA